MYYTRRLIIYLALPLLLIATVYFFEPVSKYSDLYITIPEGFTVNKLGDFLKEKNLIRSEKVFEGYYRLVYGSKLKSGLYLIEKPETVLGLAKIFSSGLFNIKTIKVTIPEGTDIKGMVSIFSNKLPSFDASLFQSITTKSGYEGFLFPDTYYLDANQSVSDIVSLLRSTYSKRINEMLSKLTPAEKEYFKNNERNIIIIASILEEEAKEEKDRAMITDIINRRMAKKLPLQLDATLGYVLNKGSLELTSDDLKASSSYNTYTNLGLTPTPISNPGISAIMSAIRPIKNNYWYYLSDKDDVIHFASTYDEHLINRQKYLGK